MVTSIAPEYRVTISQGHKCHASKKKWFRVRRQTAERFVREGDAFADLIAAVLRVLYPSAHN